MTTHHLLLSLMYTGRHGVKVQNAEIADDLKLDLEKNHGAEVTGVVVYQVPWFVNPVQPALKDWWLRAHKAQVTPNNNHLIQADLLRASLPELYTALQTLMDLDEKAKNG